MLTSLSFIFLVGLAMAAICQRIRVTRIIGMLLTGIVLGPYVLDLLDPSILSISSELRQMALIIILVKAGLSLNLADLKKVGRPAVMLSCVPASFELLGYVLFAPMILGVNRIEAAVLRHCLSATVQAAIGSVPMAMGLPCGQIVLSVAVMAILITAPLGALGMDSTFERLLERDRSFT